MTTTLQVLLGIVIGALLSAISEIGEWGSVVFLVTSCLLICVALIKGQNLMMIFRVALVVMITYFSYCMTLQGRTMSVGLDNYTIKWTAIFFGLFGMPANLILFRLFPRIVACRVMALSGVVAIIAALSVASVEENLFVTKYRETGVGPTPRWTLSHHWMSYDAENRRLEGSD